MRPVDKWPAGHIFVDSDGRDVVVQDYYKPHPKASPVLQLNIGPYCSYCEVFNSDLQVEHVIPQQHAADLKNDWNNFLISCGRCNGSDNKSSKPINMANIYLPHLNNTLYIFDYKEGGLVGIHPRLTDPVQIEKAKALLDLVGLDKYPGNPRYSASKKHPMGFPENDKRWENRRTAWEKAQRKLEAFENGEISPSDVADFAKERGFFSVWYSVFEHHPEVKKELIARFPGTDIECFDSE